MLFGVPENEDMMINGIEAAGDKEKIDVLLDYIRVKDDVEILSFARLGKPAEEDGEEDKKRPIKIVLKNSEMAALITANAKLLRPLDLMIFLKQDKTKKEREEFQRLLKKKNEYMLSHPTAEGAAPRVVLVKGELKVDGAVLDQYNTPQTIF